MTHVPWLFSPLDEVAECFEERMPIPLHLAVQMSSPAVLERAWKGIGDIKIGWKRIGELSIRNMLRTSRE
jgi:hypothetical protein